MLPVGQQIIEKRGFRTSRSLQEVLRHGKKPGIRFFDPCYMLTIIGLICIAAGATGIAVYLARGVPFSTDEKIAMLLGAFMMLIGIIIISAGRK